MRTLSFWKLQDIFLYPPPLESRVKVGPDGCVAFCNLEIYAKEFVLVETIRKSLSCNYGPWISSALKVKWVLSSLHSNLLSVGLWNHFCSLASLLCESSLKEQCPKVQRRMCGLIRGHLGSDLRLNESGYKPSFFWNDSKIPNRKLQILIKALPKTCFNKLCLNYKKNFVKCVWYINPLIGVV